MDIENIKQIHIERAENMYALAINYLKNNNNMHLKNITKELEFFEDKIRNCNDINIVDNYKGILDFLEEEIEVIINE